MEVICDHIVLGLMWAWVATGLVVDQVAAQPGVLRWCHAADAPSRRALAALSKVTISLQLFSYTESGPK